MSELNWRRNIGRFQSSNIFFIRIISLFVCVRVCVYVVIVRALLLRCVVVLLSCAFGVYVCVCCARGRIVHAVYATDARMNMVCALHVCVCCQRQAIRLVGIERTQSSECNATSDTKNHVRDQSSRYNRC